MREFGTLEQAFLYAATHFLRLVSQSAGVRVVEIKFGPWQRPGFGRSIRAANLGAAPVIGQLEEVHSRATTAALIIP